MPSALLTRENSILPFTPAADMSGKEGYSCTLAGDTATLSASATVPVKGIILEGATTSNEASILVLGGTAGVVRVKLSGTVTKGDDIQQATDGTFVTDAESGSRVIVGTALEDGVSGDLIEAVVFKPIEKS